MSEKLTYAVWIDEEHDRELVGSVEARSMREAIQLASELPGLDDYAFEVCSQRVQSLIDTVQENRQHGVEILFERENTYGRRVWIDSYHHLPLSPFAGPIAPPMEPRLAMAAVAKIVRQRQLCKILLDMPMYENDDGSRHPDDGVPFAFMRRKDVKRMYAARRKGQLGEIGAQLYFFIHDIHDPQLTDEQILAIRQLGIDLMHVLQSQGLHVEWSGDPGKALHVFDPTERQRKALEAPHKAALAAEQEHRDQQFQKQAAQHGSMAAAIFCDL